MNVIDLTWSTFKVQEASIGNPLYYYDFHMFTGVCMSIDATTIIRAILLNTGSADYTDFVNNYQYNFDSPAIECESISEVMLLSVAPPSIAGGTFYVEPLSGTESVLFTANYTYVGGLPEGATEIEWYSIHPTTQALTLLVDSDPHFVDDLKIVVGSDLLHLSSDPPDSGGNYIFTCKVKVVDSAGRESDFFQSQLSFKTKWSV